MSIYVQNKKISPTPPLGVGNDDCEKENQKLKEWKKGKERVEKEIIILGQ